MEAKELLLHSLEQSQGFLEKALDGLTQEEAEWSPTPECNSIAFILWHTFRVEDFFINRVVKREKDIYEVDGWKEKLNTPDKVYQYTVEELKNWKRQMKKDGFDKLWTWMCWVIRQHLQRQKQT